MKQDQFEKLLAKLELIKDEWKSKVDEQTDLVKSYKPTNEEKEVSEFIDKLNISFSELKSFKMKYKEELKTVVCELEKEADDPIISILCNKALDDIDYEYETYHGVREQRLRDINDLIEMYKISR